MWACRFQLLMVLGMYSLLNDELAAFENLDAPDLYFQYYPKIYRGDMKGFFYKIFRMKFHKIFF